MTPEELLREVAMLDYGNPSKLESALRLAAALAFVAHRGLDRFGLQPFSDRLGPPGCRWPGGEGSWPGSWRPWLG